MPRTQQTNRRPARDIAQDLVNVQKIFKPLEDQKEALKVDLRTFGAATYVVSGGSIRVGEPEVRSFIGRKLTVNQDAAMRLLSIEKLNELVSLGVLAWEDIYTRNAVAKVETTLADA